MAFSKIARRNKIKARIRGKISGPVNAFFYRFCIGDKKFYATDRCVSCGKCAESCLLHNISLEQGRPVWHGSCTHRSCSIPVLA